MQIFAYAKYTDEPVLKFYIFSKHLDFPIQEIMLYVYIYF